MALTKTKVVAQISVDEFGVVSIREETRLSEDGELLATKNHRSLFNPGTDVSAEKKVVRDICAVVWTPAVVSAFTAAQAALDAAQAAAYAAQTTPLP